MISRRRSLAIPSAARTTALSYTTGTIHPGDHVRGLIIYLIVSVASGTGGLSVTVNSVDPSGGNAVAFFTAAAAVTTTGVKVYVLSPDDMVAGAGVIEVAKRPVPLNFTFTVGVGDASSNTAQLLFETF